MAMVSNPEAANSDAITEDIEQNSNDVQIDIENPDMIHFSSTLKRTKENEIIQISSEKLTSETVGTEGDENATEALKGKNIKYFSKETGKILFVYFWKFSFLFKCLGRTEAVILSTLQHRLSDLCKVARYAQTHNCTSFI